MVRVNAVHQIAQETHLSSSQVKDVASVLQQCAINSINNVKRDKKLDLKGIDGKAYRITTPDTNQIVLYLKGDGTVDSVVCYNHYLYRSGKLYALQRDYVVMKSDLKAFKNGAVDAINKCLNITERSPKYPDVSKWSITQDDKGIYLKSYVEYQGSTGQTIHKNFKISCSPDKSSIVKIEIDGKIYPH